MKAITVRQPWADAIVFHGKDVENRTRLTKHRGLLAIHAGRVEDREAYSDPLIRDLPLGQVRRGVVLGVVELVDAHHGRQAHPDGDMCSPWAYVGAAHLVMKNPRPLQHPVIATGRLQLGWDLPADIAAEVLRQIGGTP